MGKTRCSRITAMVVLTLSSQAVLGQQRPQFRSRSRALRVEVWATDKNGHHVAGLTVEDFILSVDEVRVPILDFRPATRHEQGSRTAAYSDDDTASPDLPLARSGRGANYWLALDLFTRSPDPLVVARAARAGQAFLELVSPDDAVGLVIVGPKLGSQSLVDPTRDRARVAVALDRLLRGELGLRPSLKSPGGMLIALSRMTAEFEARLTVGRTDVLFFSLGDPDFALAVPSYRARLGQVSERLQRALST